MKGQAHIPCRVTDPVSSLPRKHVLSMENIDIWFPGLYKMRGSVVG